MRENEVRAIQSSVQSGQCFQTVTVHSLSWNMFWAALEYRTTRLQICQTPVSPVL